MSYERYLNGEGDEPECPGDWYPTMEQLERVENSMSFKLKNKAKTKFMEHVSEKVKELLKKESLSFEDIPERSNSYKKKLILDKLNDKDYLKYFKLYILPELKEKLHKHQIAITYDEHAIRYSIPRMLDYIERLENDITSKSK